MALGGDGRESRVLIRTLESFLAQGGDLPDLERRIILANAGTAGEIRAAVEAIDVSDDEEGSSRPRSWVDQSLHEFGVGLRGVGDGLIDVIGIIDNPLKLILNETLGRIIGDRNAFRTVEEFWAHHSPLLKPETPQEEFFMSINRGGAGAIGFVWGANSLLALKSASSASNIFWKVVDDFRAGPVGQVASAVAMEIIGKVGTTSTAQIASLASGGIKGLPRRLGRRPNNQTNDNSPASGSLDNSDGGPHTGENGATDGLGTDATKKAGAALDPFRPTLNHLTEAVKKSPYEGNIGKVVEVDLRDLNFSQTDVSFWRRKRVSQSEAQKLPGDRITEAEGRYYYWRNFDERKNLLAEHGWPQDDVLDAAIMPPNGQLTLMDNSRVTAIHELGGVDKFGNPIKPKVRIRDPRQPLTKGEQRWFQNKETEEKPGNWGEAIHMRIKQQDGVEFLTGQEYAITDKPQVVRHDMLESIKSNSKK